MVQAPGVKLRAERIPGELERLQFGTDSINSRTAADAVADPLGRAIRIDAITEIPGHQGLGSGTQLALAVAEAGCTSFLHADPRPRFRL